MGGLSEGLLDNGVWLVMINAANGLSYRVAPPYIAGSAVTGRRTFGKPIHAARPAYRR